MNPIQAAIHNLIHARATKIEAACEEALAGGVCGVLVEGDRIEVSILVPWGEIHYLPEWL